MIAANPVMTRFLELVAEVARVDEEMQQPIEPFMGAVLDYVGQHPEFRSDFAEAFVEIALDPNLGPGELVEFCMHALRWSEVRDAFVADLETEKSERVRHWLRKMIASFDDDWNRAALYERFSTD